VAQERAAALSLRLTMALEGSRAMLWFAAFIPLLAVYLLTLRTPSIIFNYDPSAVAPSAWSVAHHGTPKMHTWPSFSMWFVRYDSHYVVSNREPGLILLAAPFYALFRGAGPADQYPSAVAAALCTAAAMATLALVIRRLGSARLALTVALIAGLATSTWTVSGTALWPHGPDQLFLMISVLALSGQRYARAGIGYALALLVRPPVAVVAASTAVAEAWRRRSIRPVLVIGAWTVVGLAGFLAYSHAFWHGGLESQYTSGGGPGFVGTFFNVRPRAWSDLGLNVFGTLGSVGHGILITSPFFIVLAPGVRPAWRVAPHWVRSAAAAGLVYLFVQLKSNSFNGGEGFWGYRYPLETLTLAAPLLVLAYREWVAQTATRRAAFTALVIVSITSQIVGATCYVAQSMKVPDHIAWMPANFDGVLVHEHAVAGVTIMLSGLALAGLTYRLMTRAAAGRHSVAAHMRDIPGSQDQPLTFALDD
jgi:hypothetical protein